MGAFNRRSASSAFRLFCKATLDGFRHSLAKPVVKKKRATVEMLEAIVDDVEKSGSLSDLRLATASLTGFCRVHACSRGTGAQAI